MQVVAIWRYPVKAMLGEVLEEVEIAPGGLDGDRRWIVADAQTGERIASKRGPTDPRLRACRARIVAGDELAVTLPDGETTVTGGPAVERALSRLLEREVVLVDHAPGGGGFMQTSGHHDFAPVHLVGARSLARLREVAPESDWDPRRFRPNVLLEGDPAEADLLGRDLAGPSGVRLRVGLPTPRCVVPTRAREELPADPGLLRTIARRRRWDFGPLGRPACLGLYAEVEQAGRLGVGDRLDAGGPAAHSPQDVVAATVERVLALERPDIVGDVFVDEASHEAVRLEGIRYGGVEAERVELKDFVLTEVDLSGAKLDGLDLEDGSIEACNLANLRSQGCSFARVQIEGSRLTGAKLVEPRLTDVVFRDSPIDLSSFRFGRLDRVRFERCRLIEADFQGVVAKACTFIDCDLTGAQLSQGSFEGTGFRGCRLAGVHGLEALKGARMAWEDVMELATALAASVGIEVREDIS